jgi:predicted AAA+ superfamily ATPase
MIVYKLWFEEFGFRENPFTIRPGDNLNLHVGQEEIIKEVNKLIPKKNIIHLYGRYGSGKTSILQGIIQKFAGKKKVVYYNCNENMDRIHLKKLVAGAGTKLQRLFGRSPKNLLMLVDESQHVGVKDLHNIFQFFEKDVFISVVFASPNKDFPSFPAEYKKQLKSYALKPLSAKEAKKILKKRLGKVNLIPEAIVPDILRLDGKPRQFLMNCEDLMRIAVEDGRKKAEKKDIETLQEQQKKSLKQPSEKVPSKKAASEKTKKKTPKKTVSKLSKKKSKKAVKNTVE